MVEFVLSALTICAVVLAGAVFYYLRPSTGGHANPNGAAVTVATLRAQAIEPTHNSSALSWPGPRGLLSGHDDTATAVIVESEPPDGSDAQVLVRPFLDHADYRRAAIGSLVDRAPTVRLRSLAHAA